MAELAGVGSRGRVVWRTAFLTCFASRLPLELNSWMGCKLLCNRDRTALSPTFLGYHGKQGARWQAGEGVD